MCGGGQGDGGRVGVRGRERFWTRPGSAVGVAFAAACLVTGVPSAAGAVGLPDALAVPEALCHSDECLSLPLRSFQRAGGTVVLEQTFGRAARGSGGSSTGAAVWEGSLLLTRFLEGGPSGGAPVIGPDTRVLELGSGCGLGAVAAARLGAASVVATDGNARVLALLESNVARNGLGAPQVLTAQLQWGLDVGPDRPPEASGPPPDLVLGADLTYYPGTLPALSATLRDLDAPSVVLVHHVRQAADEASLAQLYLPGYHVRVVQLSDPDGSAAGFLATPVPTAADVPPGGFYALVMTSACMTPEAPLKTLIHNTYALFIHPQALIS